MTMATTAKAILTKEQSAKLKSEAEKYKSIAKGIRGLQGGTTISDGDKTSGSKLYTAIKKTLQPGSYHSRTVALWCETLAKSHYKHSDRLSLETIDPLCWVIDDPKPGCRWLLVPYLGCKVEFDTPVDLGTNVRLTAVGDSWFIGNQSESYMAKALPETSSSTDVAPVAKSPEKRQKTVVLDPCQAAVSSVWADIVATNPKLFNVAYPAYVAMLADDIAAMRAKIDAAELPTYAKWFLQDGRPDWKDKVTLADLLDAETVAAYMGTIHHDRHESSKRLARNQVAYVESPDILDTLKNDDVWPGLLPGQVPLMVNSPSSQYPLAPLDVGAWRKMTPTEQLQHRLAELARHPLTDSALSSMSEYDADITKDDVARMVNEVMAGIDDETINNVELFATAAESAIRIVHKAKKEVTHATGTR